jgi:hypothetical protein
MMFDVATPSIEVRPTDFQQRVAALIEESSPRIVPPVESRNPVTGQPYRNAREAFEAECG